MRSLQATRGTTRKCRPAGCGVLESNHLPRYRWGCSVSPPNATGGVFVTRSTVLETWYSLGISGNLTGDADSYAVAIIHGRILMHVSFAVFGKDKHPGMAGLDIKGKLLLTGKPPSVTTSHPDLMSPKLISKQKILSFRNMCSRKYSFK